MNQAAIAELITIIGNSAAVIAAAEGNLALAQTIQADTAAAAAAVANWQTGSATTTVIQILNLLMTALSLIPQVGPYLPLIDICIATIEAIIAELPAPNIALPLKA